MNLQLLAPHLHSTALAARKYFEKEQGAKQFDSERIVDPGLSLKPTLSAKLSDGCILCAEVSEKAYSNSLDTFVLECNSRGFPVKLYVVLPSAKGDPEFASNLRKAKERGVGVIEVSESGTAPFVVSEAVSLSLFGLRRLNATDFPKQKRDALRQAESTFLNGNPVKGCQALYDELEAISRVFAKRAKAEGWWRAPHQGEPKPKTNLD